MSNYFYLVAICMFLIGQITFVNGMGDAAVQTSLEVVEEVPVDENELCLSYVFGEDEGDASMLDKPFTLGQARLAVFRAYFEKYNTEFAYPVDDDDLERVVSRFEFALMFYPLVADEADINICEYITDVEQTDLHYGEISKLYTVGIIAGSDRYGKFSGDSDVTCGAARAMISRLKNPNERVTYNPSVEKRRHVNYFAPVMQNPELPTGCEITALTSLLNYLGFDVDKITMADTYLDKGPIGQTDPAVAFIGSPYTDASYGCYSPVIENTADKYLADNMSTLKTYRMSGVSFRNLLCEIEQGNPVVIWASMYMSPTYNSSVWAVDEHTVTWIANEHCLVIYGYDLDKNVVYTADPLVGNTEYDIDLFETRYNELLKQAIVIK